MAFNKVDEESAYTEMACLDNLMEVERLEAELERKQIELELTQAQLESTQAELEKITKLLIKTEQLLAVERFKSASRKRSI